MEQSLHSNNVMWPPYGHHNHSCVEDWGGAIQWSPLWLYNEGISIGSIYLSHSEKGFTNDCPAPDLE